MDFLIDMGDAGAEASAIADVGSGTEVSFDLGTGQLRAFANPAAPAATNALAEIANGSLSLETLVDASASGPIVDSQGGVVTLESLAEGSEVEVLEKPPYDGEIEDWEDLLRVQQWLAIVILALMGIGGTFLIYESVRDNMARKKAQKATETDETTNE